MIQRSMVFLLAFWMIRTFFLPTELIAKVEAPKVLTALFHGTINPGTASYLAQVIQQAEEEKAEAILLQLNTPGGLLESTRDMVTSISASQVPVIVYVGPEGARATSAGAFIVMASHLAVMHEGSHLGAATPVLAGGEEMPPTLKEKAISDARAFMRSIAEKRGRNFAVAEKFVTEAISLTSTQALEENIIDLQINSLKDLLAKIDGKSVTIVDRDIILNTANAEVIEVPRRLIDWFLMELAKPEIAFLLVSLGLMGVYLEFASPGLLFPGLGGSVALITGLILMYVLPAQIGFGLLLILGLTLMALEVYVAGFGALGIVGFIAFLLGSLNLFDDPMIDDFQTTVWIVAGGLGFAVALMLVVIRGGWLSLDRRNRLHMLGKHGMVMADFQGKGYVLIDGKKTAAFSEQFLQRNLQVKVIEFLEDGSVKVAADLKKD
ncbi:MAG: NfeD family protein [Oligoflexus sp.]